MDAGNYKLNLLLKTLTTEEWAEAHWFLSSPHYKKKQALLTCFEVLQAFFEKSPPTREELFHFIFKKEPIFNDDKMRRLMSDLTLALEDYLAWRQLQQNKNGKAQLVVEALRQRNAGDLFHKKTHACLLAFQQSPPVGAADFQALGELHHQLYFHPEAENYQANYDPLFQAVHNLEISFALRLLCYRAEMLARKTLLADQLPAFCFEPGLEEACQKLAPECPAIELFLKLLTLFSAEKKQEAFQAAWQAYLRHDASGFSFEQAMAFKILLQFAIAQSNRGGLEAHRNVLKIYQLGLEQKLMTEPGAGITAGSYLNVALAAMLAEEFDWAVAFEKKYQGLLPEKDRQATLDLCNAYLHFYRSRNKKTAAAGFDSALDLLQKIPRAHELFEFRMRALQMRIFYEHPRTQPDKFLLDLARNFERYFQSNRQFSPAFKTSNVLFSKHFRQLVKLRSSQKLPGESAHLFLQKLKEENQAAYLSWLLEKAEELLPTPPPG